MRPTALSPFALLVAAGLLWGTGGVTGHALADHSGLSAPAIAAYRLGLGGLLLTVVLLLRRRPLPRSRAAWIRLAATGGLAAVFQAAYFAAVAVGSVPIATFVAIGSAPIFVVVAQAVRRRATPDGGVIRAVAIGLIGLGLLIGSQSSDGGSSPACFALASLSGGAFAAFTLLGRRSLPPDLDEPTVTGIGFLLGGASLALATAPFATLDFAPSLHALTLVVVFAIFPTALAYTLFFAGLRGSTAAAAALVALLEPLTGTVLAMILFGDRMTGVQILGAALLLVSVADGGRVRPNAATMVSA